MKQQRVLTLTCGQPRRLTDIHTTIPGLPLVNGGIADAVLATKIGNGNPSLVLFQNTDDLIFGEPAALELLPVSWTAG